MNTKLLISVSCILATGVCLAQAPVVDAQNTSTAQAAKASPVTRAVDLSAPAITSVELEQRLATIERIVESRTESQQRMQTQVDMLQSDIDDMRGSIELHNHQLEKLLERQRELFLELDRRFAGMQQTTNSVASNANNAGASMPSAAPSGGDEQTMYQNAVNLILKDKDYDKAVPAFKTFLAQYPNTGLTANAHYWLGQLLYNQQKLTEAKEQFSQVATKFSDSPKRSDSLLKLGLIEKTGGNLSAARNLFQQVVNEYPNSTPARLAQQQLTN